MTCRDVEYCSVVEYYCLVLFYYSEYCSDVEYYSYEMLFCCQFGFNLRQQNNNLHLIVLINITENTRKALDDGNIIHLFSQDR